ncbi:hypothetical protein F5Y17DRAFT_427681 [Xylariaceae sp. FL0594]|nr:hypothetical protein F5Y17DRAFT_427681 [Xylariaceae sp. FL0594]
MAANSENRALAEDASTPQASTPYIKYEASPAESFLSTPGDMYPSLFETTPVAETIQSIMTPRSLAGEDVAAGSPTPVPTTPAPQAAETEKKPVKKRKSWGQVLPEPKTNLPPRKRAKTEDEKEQRRVERVLRNRRAAQSSRERKRQEVEALEKRNADLEALLIQEKQQKMLLLEELNNLRRASGQIPPLDTLQPSPDTFQPSPLSLSQPFQEPVGNAPQPESAMLDDFIMMPEQDRTVNLAVISPELNPIPDVDVVKSTLATSTATTTEAETGAAPRAASSPSDVTQHPAAVLCDLQCPSFRVRSSRAMLLFQNLQTLLTVFSVLITVCHQPLILINGALKSNLALQPTPLTMSTIIWLVTLPPTSLSSTSLSSLLVKMSTVRYLVHSRDTTRTRTSPNPISASSTLRINSLRKLLTCSPILARPLLDATMEFLRFVSKEGDDQVEELTTGSPGIERGQSPGPLLWPDGASLPSRELLLTLLWAIRVEERRLSQQGNDGESASHSPFFEDHTSQCDAIILPAGVAMEG